MRNPDVFKYDVRVRDRMLRAGRITSEEVGRILEALPDLESSVESVPLNQPALDAAAMATSASVIRQTYPPVADSDDDDEDEPAPGDSE